ALRQRAAGQRSPEIDARTQLSVKERPSHTFSTWHIRRWRRTGIELPAGDRQVDRIQGRRRHLDDACAVGLRLLNLTKNRGLAVALDHRGSHGALSLPATRTTLGMTLGITVAPICCF